MLNLVIYSCFLRSWKLFIEAPLVPPTIVLMTLTIFLNLYIRLVAISSKLKSVQQTLLGQLTWNSLQDPISAAYLIK